MSSSDTSSTNLIDAVTEGDIHLVKSLLDSGADPNVQGKNKNTALISASEKGFTNIVKLLLGRGADPNLRDIWSNCTDVRIEQRAQRRGQVAP